MTSSKIAKSPEILKLTSWALGRESPPDLLVIGESMSVVDAILVCLPKIQIRIERLEGIYSFTRVRCWVELCLYLLMLSVSQRMCLYIVYSLQFLINSFSSLLNIRWLHSVCSLRLGMLHLMLVTYTFFLASKLYASVDVICIAVMKY